MPPGGGSSIYAGYKWQCVELVNRLYISRGWINARWTGNGGEMYDTAPSGMSKQLQGSIATVTPGDVIVLQDGSFGHVAIVDSVSAPTNGVRTISTVSQNTTSVYKNVSWSNGSLAWAGYTVKGVVHDPDNTYTNTPPAPTSPSVSDSQQGTLQGDFNGDSYSDVAVMYGYDSTTTGIWLFLGDGNGALSAPVAAWNSGAGNWDWTANKPFVGDFNADGKTDIGVLYGYAASESKLWVFTSQGTTFDAPTMVWSSGAGGWDWSLSKAVVPGDFDGDGKADVAVMYGYTGAQTGMFVFKGNGTGGFAAPAEWWNSGLGGWAAASSKLTAGDTNGDGKTDLLAMYDYGSSQAAVFTFSSTGTAFGAPISQWNSGAGNWTAANSTLVAGDYTGDGKSDLGVFYKYPNSQTKIQVLTATSSGGLTAPAVWWDSGISGWDGARTIPFVGQYTTDVKADLGAFYRYDDDRTAAFIFGSTGTTFGAPAEKWNSGQGAWNGARVLVV